VRLHSLSIQHPSLSIPSSFLIMSVIIGTVFLRLEDSTSAFFSRGGILFLAVLFTTLVPLSEIPTLYGQRPIVLRQKKAAMYHPFIEAFAMTLADIPITLITLTIYSVVLYFVVGLQASAGQFLSVISTRPVFALADPSYSVFYLFIISISLMMKAYFRTIAAAFANPAPAQALAGVSLLILTLYTGYNIPAPRMIGALRWIIWVNVGPPSDRSNAIINKLYTACQVRVRIDPNERIPYLERNMFVSCSFWRWIRRSFHPEPGLSRRWSNPRPILRRR